MMGTIQIRKSITIHITVIQVISSPGGYNSNSYEATYSNTGAVATVTPTGDITSKEDFVTVGLDFTPY